MLNPFSFHRGKWGGPCCQIEDETTGLTEQKRRPYTSYKQLYTESKVHYIPLLDWFTHLWKKKGRQGSVVLHWGGLSSECWSFWWVFLARHGKEWEKEKDVEPEVTIKRRSRWINDEEDNVEEDETEQIRLSVAAPFLQPNHCSHICLHKHCILLQELQLSCWW